jgi:hypothetical protein
MINQVRIEWVINTVKLMWELLEYLLSVDLMSDPFHEIIEIDFDELVMMQAALKLSSDKYVVVV